jgi:hypothetical protein
LLQYDSSSSNYLPRKVQIIGYPNQPAFQPANRDRQHKRVVLRFVLSRLNAGLLIEDLPTYILDILWMYISCFNLQRVSLLARAIRNKDLLRRSQAKEVSRDHDPAHVAC